jgi:hypothetical protein
MITNRIETIDDLRRETATLGMVLWSLSVEQAVPDRERLLSLGLEVCDVVAAVTRTPPECPTFEEAAFIDRFYDQNERSILHPRKLQESGLVEKAGLIRDVIERLLHFERVSRDELSQSSDLCSNIYNAV